MQLLRRDLARIIPAILATIVGASTLAGQTAANPHTAQANAVLHDGQHDFDSLIGTWRYHLKRRVRPLTGSNDWIEFEGEGTCSRIWNGRANLDQIEVDGPNGHIEGLTLRLYNPRSRQWSLYWANSKDGTIAGPPQVGGFSNGRGEFYAQDSYNGRMILIRYVWTDLTKKSPHFEQSFSDDGGKTWEVNWITDQTRINDHDAAQ